MIRDVVFEGSFPRYRQLPAPSLPEFAFWGRSNVGKSSLINMLVRKKKMARTSSKPGRTQTFNLYRIDDRWRITDLPGLGYARVSLSQRRQWQREIWQYLRERPALHGVIYLIDSRIPPQQADMHALQKIQLLSVPLLIALTKTDKLSKNKLAQSMQRLRQALKNTLPVIPMTVPVSVIQARGQQALLHWIVEQMEMM